jgi:uracil phosphoribosyltransferase
MLHILDHPLAAHALTHLRDKTTHAAAFRTLCHQLTLLLAIEATRTLPTEAKVIETPMEPATGRVLSKPPLVVVPILRAGLGMVQPFIDLFPDVSVGHIGLERDHKTAQARHYYYKLPPLSASSHIMLVDPMLATGGSAVKAIDLLRAQGAVNISLLSIVSAPEGIAEVEVRFPNLPIFTAALDRQLNERKYILPGLGDFGDRLFGT